MYVISMEFLSTNFFHFTLGVRFFTNQINPISLGSWCFKGTEESTPKMDSSVPLTHHDPNDLGLIFSIKKHKIRFRILSDLGIQSWIFLKKRTLS